MLFLRITPILPNWFINISSPIVGISFLNFFFATLFGLMPANIIHVRTGIFLNDMDKIGLNLNSLFLLVLIGFVALIPIIFKSKI